MSNLTDLNGAPVTSEKKSTITIEYNHITGQMKVGGEIGTLDQALNVLAQATRYFQARYDHQQAMIFAAEAERDAQIQRRVGSLLT